MKIDRRQALAVLLASTVWDKAWGQAPLRPADIPVDSFFQRPQLGRAALNPTGTHVALCTRGTAGRARLVVVELETLAQRVVAAFDDADVITVRWLSERRLIFYVFDEEGEGKSGQADYLAVDADGTALQRLLTRGSLVSQGPQMGDDALFSLAQDISEGPGFLSLWRVNTRTGKLHELDVPPWSRGFLIDNQGEPLAALAAHGETARLHWRDGDRWRLVQEHERFFSHPFALLGLSPDGTVYVSSRSGHDQSALYTYDPSTNTVSAKALLRLNQFDMEPALIFGKGKLLGVHVQADANTTVWLDEETQALQAAVDEKLPDTTNLLSLPRRGESPWVLVWAYSDQQPVLALVYHRERKKLTLLGRSMPQIAPALMSAMNYTPYAARDGRTIPAYLTLPHSAGSRRPLPLVVLVHGGPFSRGSSWGWNAKVQFLASRGYAVLQPEFRGSTGFGESHFKAGWKQWGQAMQDDLADGARWAAAQGHADPARVAIAGGNYGGYAALMGLARQSDVFACAVNWLGPTDLDLIYGAQWSDQSDVFKRYGLPKVLGDRRADADMLRKHSPIHLAQSITKPVLMAYGKLDLHLSIEHGERMRDALEPHNKQVEWVRYDDEGHGWYRQKTKRDFWTRVERFLAQHLKA